MRTWEYWRNLIRMVDFKDDIKPNEYEIYNGTIIFWFQDETSIKDLLLLLKERNLPFEVKWDRDGMLGISIKREIIS